jgi:hypothetical protein
MKKLLFALVCALMLGSCDNATGPSGTAGLQTHAYFPYSIGDEYVWQVRDRNFDSTYTRTWRVTTAQKIDSHYYNVHVSDEYWHHDIKVGEGPAMRRDTSLYRVQGDSIFFRNGTFVYLSVDFARNYQPGGGSTFMYVKDTSNVVVPAGTFAGKIMRWDDGRHIYARGVGMIYSEYIFSSGYEPVEIRLQSAKIGGRSYP